MFLTICEVSSGMGKSYAALLQEMIETLKANKDQQIQRIELKLNKLHDVVTVFANARTRNAADLVLTEQIPKWKEYQALNLNEGKVKRIVARIQQAFVAAKETTLASDLLEKCENIYKTLGQSCENINQTITSIEQLMITFEKEENSEKNLLKLACTIQQAEFSFQNSFDEMLLDIKKIEETYEVFIKMMEEMNRIVCWEIKQYEENIKKTQKNSQEAETKAQIIPQLVIKLDEDPAVLDKQFCSVVRQPKQTKKDAYITALRIWADEKEHASTQKIALANYLFQKAGNHILAKDKRWRPLSIFSIKTTSMARAQGLLAHGLSEQDKQQLKFNKNSLERKKAREAYDVEMGCSAPPLT